MSKHHRLKLRMNCFDILNSSLVFAECGVSRVLYMQFNFELLMSPFKSQLGDFAVLWEWMHGRVRRKLCQSLLQYFNDVMCMYLSWCRHGMWFNAFIWAANFTLYYSHCEITHNSDMFWNKPHDRECNISRPFHSGTPRNRCSFNRCMSLHVQQSVQLLIFWLS